MRELLKTPEGEQQLMEFMFSGETERTIEVDGETYIVKRTRYMN